MPLPDAGLGAQAVGALGFGISTLAFWLPGRDRILYIGALGALFWALHYFMLGLRTPAALEVLSGVRLLASVWAYRRGRGAQHLLCATWLAVLGVSLAGERRQDHVELFVAASVLSVVSAIYFAERPMRVTLLLAEVLWFAFSWQIHSWAGMAMAVVASAINAYVLCSRGVGGGAQEPKVEQSQDRT